MAVFFKKLSQKLSNLLGRSISQESSISGSRHYQKQFRVNLWTSKHQRTQSTDALSKKKRQEKRARGTRWFLMEVSTQLTGTLQVRSKRWLIKASEVKANTLLRPREGFMPKAAFRTLLMKKEDLSNQPLSLNHPPITLSLKQLKGEVESKLSMPLKAPLKKSIQRRNQDTPPLLVLRIKVPSPQLKPPSQALPFSVSLTLTKSSLSKTTSPSPNNSPPTKKTNGLRGNQGSLHLKENALPSKYAKQPKLSMI